MRYSLHNIRRHKDSRLLPTVLVHYSLLFSLFSYYMHGPNRHVINAAPAPLHNGDLSPSSSNSYLGSPVERPANTRTYQKQPISRVPDSSRRQNKLCVYGVTGDPRIHHRHPSPSSSSWLTGACRFWHPLTPTPPPIFAAQCHRLRHRY